ncbi:CRE-SEL-2 protein [Caenorhabditis remanei]|uniref:CRE-SEL-2 protein n=1 Tax=Caenorhabditis remanei TaxID=31234 RepID=E3MCW3_CAERE|nr:CRE-SEL-2 protein [Caenorhabditis remanei]
MEISETSHNESGPPTQDNGTVQIPAEDEVNDEESNMETVDLGGMDDSSAEISTRNVFKNIDDESSELPSTPTEADSNGNPEDIVVPSSVLSSAPSQDVSPNAAIESLPPLPEGKELELEDDVTSSLPRLLSKTTLIHSNEEGADETIQRLVVALHSNSPNTDRTQIVDNLFNLLVGGHFDQESKFVIEEASNVDHMLTLLSHCDCDLQNEIWSLFLAVMKKSNRNLEACTRVGLISKVLDLLPEAPPLLADLLVQIIAALVAYSINVKQTKHLLRALKSTRDQWPPNSLKLLHVLKEMPQHDSADVFFSFPGKDQSGIILPPIKTMPYQQGWTFATWLRMEPLNSVTFEKEQPVLYSFRTSKGIGYSCHFTGNCLVVNVEKTKGKEQSRCVRAELGARKWHHIAIAHCYSRWGRSDIKCFIDGQLAETIELSWVVTSATNWDRCSIGVSADGTANSAFCGQMGAMYLFAEALSLQQANSLFCLGPAYQSTFKHDSETSLPEGYKKHLFDGHLHSSLVFAYCPKNCHGQLCLYTPPKTAANTYFVQIPHAVMKEVEQIYTSLQLILNLQGVEVITTHSIHKSLQSVGGIQILLPLFAQIDLPSSNDNSIDGEVCQTLLSLISLLLSSSQSSQQQLFHSKGFLIISSCLQKASPYHLSMKVLEQLIHIAKFLLRCPAGGPLLKHLFDYILFNPKLWIRARPDVQVHLYQYLASDFLANNNFSQMLRRVPTVIEMCHTLKHFYWLALPQTASDYTVEERPENFATADIVAIRSAILTFINRIIIASAGPEEEERVRDQEVHTLLNLLATVREDDNLYDVLALVTRLLAEHPAIMIPAIDKNKALGIIFNLLAAPNELIRIPALKILGFFLSRSTLKRKTESMGNQNLFSLIGERLLSHKRVLSLPTYNVLLEILVEQMTPTFTYAAHQPAQPEWKFENPQLLKVIAHVISQCEESESIVQIKKCFLLDIINLCKDSKENRRTILQMSVWQDWLIGLAYVFHTTESQNEVSELVWEAFSILLHHALRHEYGGWRVWVDTLAIAHSKVSFERFKKKLADAKTKAERTETGGEESKMEPTPVYRAPEFAWSEVHIHLLADLLSGIEGTVGEWKTADGGISDQCNASESQVFVGNVIHVISQLADSLIMACGGLLPLLASATAPNNDMEIVDPCQQQLPISVAASFLMRFARLVDTFVLASGVSFSELEQEKNMPAGGVLRQSLRISATVTVRHILASRIQQPDTPRYETNSTKKNQCIMEFVREALENPSPEGLDNVERLVQDSDITRIKGVVYRDMVEENRQAQFLALSVIYLVSVLMVSRYRDILEPPSSPSPFFDTTTQKQDNQDNESLESTPENGANGKLENDGDNSSIKNGTVENENVEEETEENREEGQGDDGRIAAIKVASSGMKKDGNEYNEEELSKINQANGRRPSTLMPVQQTAERRAYLTTKLQTALETCAPLLREMMSDFRGYLQKTLLGTHGQEIMNDTKVLETLRNRNASVIELVMLLCSQEWQTSLQKHAGLAFIELVNEGRLMAHATRDHVLRVANEADFILNRLRAEDVGKHAQFEAESRDQLLARHEEYGRCDLLIVSGRLRDSLNAARLLEKMSAILTDSDDSKPGSQFWKLDVWEDDSRRRKRFVPNPYGSRHDEANLPEGEKNEEPEISEQEKIRKILKGLFSQRQTTSGSLELVDESDIDKWAQEVDPTPSSRKFFHRETFLLVRQC